MMPARQFLAGTVGIPGWDRGFLLHHCYLPSPAAWDGRASRNDAGTSRRLLRLRGGDRAHSRLRFFTDNIRWLPLRRAFGATCNFMLPCAHRRSYHRVPSASATALRRGRHGRARTTFAARAFLPLPPTPHTRGAMPLAPRVAIALIAACAERRHWDV